MVQWFSDSLVQFKRLFAAFNFRLFFFQPLMCVREMEIQQSNINGNTPEAEETGESEGLIADAENGET